ncbi:protein ecdysoneless homolog [Mercenaria mercenaria]|uniref:protein ecdysoneless homolog n=1 Tax=Mercenaria mercenaria TaxID=6596 RepID=UPI00234F1878|nr:protein ecdysoneless homolog [Mercenaria mercenaria]
MAEKQNRVAEDVVEYCLFPLLSESENGSDDIKNLQQCINSFLTFLSPTLIDVIWQNEGFKLKAVEEKGSSPVHLLGETNFGENVQDEWFIVYLIFQLTKHFTGLVAKIRDSDEEFLLIEAADGLPKWLNPESAENRVYIYNGELHIIPIPQSPADVAAFPRSITSIGDAVECVRTYSEQTRASKQIQTAINNRIKNFPDLMSEHTHYAHCYIPASIAAVLDEKPQLIAPAVRAFYYRDPIDLKCCRTFQYFRPGTRVVHRTRLTRCLYAQLVHQNFQPDKRSGWVIPSTSSPKFRSHDLGMKLAHGFEIMCHKSESGGNHSNINDDQPTSGVRWQQYIQTLKDKNYFRGELEGSVLYEQLMGNARKFYKENFRHSNRGDDPGAEVLHLLKTLDVDIEGRRRAEQYLESPDDDSWMNLTPESLDEMMRERSGNYGNQEDTDNVFDLGKIADSMKAFVGNVSSADGAEFPSAGDDVEEDETQFEDSCSDSSSDMDEYGWEEDEEGKTSSSKHARIKRPPSLDKYMDIMDKELSKTDVGKSFEKQKKKTEKDTPGKVQTPDKDINEEDDDFQPVDIDLNTVKNLLESYGAQEGLAGPTSNILGSMGVTIPPNMDNIENGENTNIPSKINAEKKPMPKPRPKPAARTSTNTTQKAAPPRPPPPRAARTPRARLDSKETDV